MGFFDLFKGKKDSDIKGSLPSQSIPKGYKYVGMGDTFIPDGEQYWAQYTEIYEDKDGNRIEIKKWGLI